jgi:hypothetical protein
MWTEPNLLAELSVNPQDASDALEILKEIFHAHWTKNAACDFAAGHPVHPLLQTFFMEGWLPLQTLYQLGEDLVVLKKRGLLGGFPNRLRNRQEFQGARAEIKYLAFFARMQFQLKRNVRSGEGNKNCDFNASLNSDQLNVEITAIEMAKKNKESTERFSMQLLEYIRGLRSSVPQGVEILQEAEVKKIIQTMEQKLAQFPESGPGFLIIKTAFPLSDIYLERIRESFHLEPEKYRRLSEVITVFDFFSINGPDKHSSWIINPDANFKVDFNPLENE